MNFILNNRCILSFSLSWTTAFAISSLHLIQHNLRKIRISKAKFERYLRGKSDNDSARCVWCRDGGWEQMWQPPRRTTVSSVTGQVVGECSSKRWEKTDIASERPSNSRGANVRTTTRLKRAGQEAASGGRGGSRLERTTVSFVR